MSETTDKCHWFCFSYQGYALDNGEKCKASTYTGYPLKYVNMKMIQDNKEFAGVDKDAVLISCSYLGHMTKEDFLGEES